MKKVTIRDIAAAAGVSGATVSRALAGNSCISEDTKRRVRRISEEMGYSPNFLSLEPQSLSAELVGIIVPDLLSPQTAALVSAAERYLRKKGIDLMLCCSEGTTEGENACLARLIRRKADGVLFMPSSRKSPEVLFSKLEKIPTVFVGENLMDTPQSFVTADYRRGAAIAVTHLAKLGHKHIVLLDDSADSTAHQLMQEGFFTACASCGIQGRTSLWGKSDGMEYTAIISPAEEISLEVIQASKKQGKSLAVISMEESFLAQSLGICLTTVAPPTKKLAQIACDMLLNQLCTESDGYSHRILVPCLTLGTSSKNAME